MFSQANIFNLEHCLRSVITILINFAMVYCVHNLSFNQDMSCFSCSMDSGVKLYNAEPLMEKCYIDAEQIGSVSQVVMYNRSNLLAVLSGGLHPKFPSNVVKIWDDKLKKFVAQFTFGSKVLNVVLCRSKLVVVLSNSVHVFSFPNNSKTLLQIDTKMNLLGLCQVSQASDRQMLVTLGHKSGSLQLTDLSKIRDKDSGNIMLLSAHKTNIACLAVNNQGTMVATASEKGTLIRLFDAQTQKQLVELRRGTDQAILHSISFSRDSSYLCAASDKGTVHIFALKDKALNRRSAFAKAGKVSPFQDYTNSQWSFCCFTVPPECPCTCVFGCGNSVIAVCVDGTYHRYAFSTDGTCTREAYNTYLELENETDF